MSVAFEPKKIIWAVDAQQEMKGLQQDIVESIRALIRGHEGVVEIQPVFVLTTALESGHVLTEILSQNVSNYLHEIKGVLAEKLKGIGLANLRVPEVIVNEMHSIRGAVESLNKYAMENSADLIVVGTHGRRGIKRLFLGSFAETVLLYSRLPVFIVNFNSKSVFAYDHILFPTDFGRPSENALDKVLRLGSSLKARVTLLHMIREPFLIEPTLELVKAQECFLEAAQESARQKAADFEEKAKKEGIPFEVQIEVTQLAVHDAILKFAKSKEIRLVAMAAQSGSIMSVIAGSVTRQVVRSANCPVWVFHDRLSAQSVEPSKAA